MNLRPLFIGLFLFLYCNPLLARENSLPDTTASFIELVGVGTSIERTPFWMQANQFGIVPRRGTFTSIRAGIESAWSLNSKSTKFGTWQAGLGIEGSSTYSVINQVDLLLPQVYGTLQFKNWELLIGKRKQLVGLADSTLGTGSFIWSGNALPLPKIQLGLKQFTTIPFTGGWVAVQGFYSDGRFENNRPWTSKLKLHQKALYLRLSKPGGRLKLYGGFNHQVQWGGKTLNNTVDGQMPTGLRSYMYAITGRKPHGSIKNGSWFDNTNRVGNHLGTIDAGLELDGIQMAVFIYHQSIYEDGSLYRLQNLRDGLNGIRIRNKRQPSSNFTWREGVLELLYTKSQGGNGDFGNDNYFNNGQVWDGWSYYCRTIGSPFIPPTVDTAPLWPSYQFTSNNRVWVLHTGMKGTFLNTYEWSTKLSYSSNSGTYDLPFHSNPEQFSGLLSVQRRINWLGGNTIIKGTLAADFGDLYQNTTGIMLSIRKEGWMR